MNNLVVLNQTGLVLQGGGTRGAFTAGVLDVFLEHKLFFPYVIGTSAGALNGVNFLSRDHGRSKTVTTELMGDRKFVSLGNFFRRGTFFNFAYLFHTVPKTILPFSSAIYNASPAEFTACATSVIDGKPRFYKKGECREFYKALAASSSLPLLARPVDVDGELCLDGGLTAPVPFEKALEDGQKKVVVVGTREAGYRKKPQKPFNVFLTKCMYHKYPKLIEAYKLWPKRYNENAEELERLVKEGKIFCIRPEVAPGVGVAEKDSDKLRALYDEGRRIAEMNLDAMMAYLKEDNEPER